MNHGDINTNYINNINGYQNINTNRLTNVIYSSGNKENIIKGNYNNYYTNLNLNIKNKKRKKKTNSCEMNDKIKYIENLLSPHKNNKNKRIKKRKLKVFLLKIGNIYAIISMIRQNLHLKNVKKLSIIN